MFFLSVSIYRAVFILFFFWYTKQALFDVWITITKTTEHKLMEKDNKLGEMKFRYTERHIHNTSKYTK